MSPDDTPWFVRAALGAVAWIGGLSLMTFIGLVVGSDALAAPVGVALLVAAVALRRLAPAALADLWIQLSLLLVVTGRLALGVGLRDQLSDEMAALAQVPVEILLFLGYPGTAPRLAAVLLAATSLAMALGDDIWLADLLALVLFGAAALLSELEEPLAAEGLAWAWKPLVLGCALWPVAVIGGGTDSDPQLWAYSLGIALVGAGLAARWLHQQAAAPVTWVAVGAAALALFAIGGPVPGTLAGLVSAGMAFRRQDRLWLGASLTALVAHGVVLYWKMDLPFLQKGWAMIGLGAVLVIIATLAAPRRRLA